MWVVNGEVEDACEEEGFLKANFRRGAWLSRASWSRWLKPRRACVRCRQLVMKIPRMKEGGINIPRNKCAGRKGECCLIHR